MPSLPRPELLQETHRIIAEARELLDSGAAMRSAEEERDASQRFQDGGVLSLYEQLRTGLERIEDSRIRQLLARAAANVERLRKLDDDVERLRGLRRALEDL